MKSEHEKGSKEKMKMVIKMIAKCVRMSALGICL